MQTSQYHLFSLPQDLLDSITLRNLVNLPKPRTPSPEPLPSEVASGQRACNVCLGATFQDVEEQRNHFKSDWHRYNVKSRVNGGKSVEEIAFNQLVEGLDDSLSGSASSEDDDDEDSDDAVNTLVKRTGRIATRSPSPDSARLPPLTALVWFHSPPSTQLGLYRSVFPLKTEPKDYVSELMDLQTSKPGGRTWAMFMVAGGHFAGAIVRVSPDEPEEDEEGKGKAKSKKQKRPKPDTEIILHKTFHRYTTRRKQGGSQSVNDNAKGPAKSAGAQLRRYGEQALRDDIRNLLNEWSDDLDDCERIWIRASTSNKRIFFDYEDTPIQKGDDRLRTYPFPTRRPTQSEIVRCLAELTRVKISHYTESQLREQDELYLASLPKPKPVPTAPAPIERVKPQVEKLSPEEEALREKWTRMLEMVSKGRLEPLKVFWEREKNTFGGIDAPIPGWSGERVTTVLQLASRAGQVDVVQWLLQEARADPIVPVASTNHSDGPVDATDPDGGNASDASNSARPKGSARTAYDLAKTKAVRDVFRRCAGLHLDWWDWLGAGHVPSVLSQDMEDEQEQKKKVRRKGLKDKVKEREAKEKLREKSEAPTVAAVKPSGSKPVTDSGSNRLGGASGSVVATAGLTPEMRLRLERERRARAAEARLRTLGGK